MTACGTDAGYHAHRYRGEDQCPRCREAHCTRERERRTRSRQFPSPDPRRPKPSVDDGWRAKAACAGYAELFFAEEKDLVRTNQAKALCSRCPVLTQCFEDNERHESGNVSQIFGVYGGETPRERSRRRRVQRRRELASA